MATPETSSPSPPESSIPTTSHDTALCIIPPRRLWPSVDRLRALYDKAYEKWPPHINMIYPFVRPDLLPSAAQRIQDALSHSGIQDPLHMSLGCVDVFPHKHDNTIFLHDSSAETSARLKTLRDDILGALGQARSSGQQYRMHMTVGQSDDVNGSPHKFLVDKVGLLPALEWEVETLYLLVRERVQLDGTATSQMKIWGTISLSREGRPAELSRPERPLAFYEGQHHRRLVTEGDEDSDAAVEKDSPQTQEASYCFDDERDQWLPFPAADDYSSEEEIPSGTLSIASYNVLAEFEHPPSSARYPLLLRNILAEDATADILVLQEVTDSFLSYLLESPAVRDRFPFTSHGPPTQPDVDPLPSLLNIVVLSRFAFDWEYVSFSRKHKGALVARLPSLPPSTPPEGPQIPLILAAIHLTCGLTDGSVTAKKTDVQRILRYLTETYPHNPWVLAGDFNISTSSYTIDAALKKNAVSKLSVSHLASIDGLLAEAKLEDAWVVMKDCGDGDEDESDDLLEGEQGATYDPVVNEVAAAIVGSGYGMRPQRYDRILVRGEGSFKIAEFNRFGLGKGRAGQAEEESYASDHWGVRCMLEVGDGQGVLGKTKISDEISSLVVPVELTEAPAALSAPESVHEALAELGVFPTEKEGAQRRAALNLLKSILLETPAVPADVSGAASRLQPTVVVVPVGSYALGVWTSASDIDVLCIGPFSTSTFFALATRRLRKAAAQDVRILRRVKANTGTMLELEVGGIKMDLQYCPATSIAEQYPQVLRIPPSNPVWSLSAPTLSKLKALRDMDYLRRSIPDLTTFRLAHRFIKTWARTRGIYSARFGFLGSIQISLLLARVVKLLPHSVSLPDLLTTFFSHYSTFPWATHLVFDPLFHKQRLPYTRTSREPLAILGYFPPALNTSHAASMPSTRAIVAEFSLASTHLKAHTLTSWTDLLRPSGATTFLTSYTTYVRLDVQYWGISPSRGRRFIGWLESRCVLLLVDLHRRATGLHARMWPARFVVTDTSPASNPTPSSEDEGQGEEPRDYRGCYLIGLEKLNPDMSKDDLKTALGGMRTALRRFEELIRGDEKYFDSRSCWLAAEIANRSHLGGGDILEIDDREWGEYTAGDDEEDEDDDDEDEDDADGLGSGLEDLDISGDAATKKKSKKQLRKEKENKQEEAYKLETGKKFRTAADVINRIRWDPEIESSEFLVGYEDRFVGAREKALDAWKSEQTDEEFIPQHRILYFKRKNDGEVLWERRTRKDEIFGSGL